MSENTEMKDLNGKPNIIDLVPLVDKRDSSYENSTQVKIPKPKR